MISGWYLPATAYYVATDEAGSYPLRQGDILPGTHVEGGDWLACQLLHPTCELAKSSVDRIQVIRVRRLEDVQDSSQRALVCTGWQEKEGAIQIAVAHTFFLAPVADISSEAPLFSNFRELATVPRKDLLASDRVATLTHEARITFIRRLIYYRFRYHLTFDNVLALEKARIANDPAFKGPRPAWAMLNMDQGQ